jgi:GPH family glycoside/pentoside/hexuronide:cation symporter
VSYFVGITIITSGLMYFVTVLLELPEEVGNKLMITMVLVSLLFYYPINVLSDRVGKKILMIISFFLLSFVFLGIFFLGKITLNPELQIYARVIFAAIPLASLNILPNAFLADIIQQDTLRSGENKEAMYFAVRYFFVKIAQTFGIAIFAILLGFGKNAGDDDGIRANGLLGFGLCLLAGIVFSRFREATAPGQEQGH